MKTKEEKTILKAYNCKVIIVIEKDNDDIASASSWYEVENEENKKVYTTKKLYEAMHIWNNLINKIKGF